MRGFRLSLPLPKPLRTDGMAPHPRRVTFTVLVALSLAGAGFAADLPRAEPADVGLSGKHLQRADNLLRAVVDQGDLAGAVGLVVRHGHVAYFEAHGRADDDRPMGRDAIFRIASMTKPVTAAAVLALYEQGAFRLQDPVSAYLPEFADVRVLVPDSLRAVVDSATVPAQRPIRISDLLTHTSGLTYHWNDRVGDQLWEQKIPHGLHQVEGTLADAMGRLARIPLVHSPGQAWTYGLGLDVAGRLVEVVAGQDLFSYMESRIFDPLEMDDTGFYLGKKRAARLAAVYSKNAAGTLQRMVADSTYMMGQTLGFSIDYPTDGPTHYYAGGGGLCSTAGDYGRFAQMLANGGELDGKRILSRKSVELMASDHVGTLLPDYGFGLGVAVIRDPGEFGELSSPGAFTWGGFFSTHF